MRADGTGHRNGTSRKWTDRATKELNGASPRHFTPGGPGNVVSLIMIEKLPTRLGDRGGQRSKLVGRLTGKRAVVTGAAGGLGKAIAERFAQEGAELVLLDLKGNDVAGVSAGVRQRGGSALDLAVDVTDEAAVADAFARISAEWPHIDILINNVGGFRNAKLWDMSADDWDFTLRLNLRSAFLCTRAVAPGMMRRSQGSIVCMSSGAREGTPWVAYYAGNSSYSASKAGIHGFVREVSMELAEHGVRVNAVAPGPIETDVNRVKFAQLETIEHSVARMVPMRRMGQPVEVANAVLFLASDEASYITGVTLDVAGGRL